MRVLLIVVLAAATTACASSGAVPKPFPRPDTSGGSAASATAGGGAGARSARGNRTGGYEISGTALALRGTPYRDGGNDPSGFDCSGFVWYVFAQHGVPLPRTVGAQSQTGERVPAGALKPGDLVFFSTVAPGASHVGIVIGGDSFVHAPSNAGVVRVERMSASYWAARFVGARRVL
ncbi:MAG TPA: C40 family peptidase [Vicinamibacterales bacterium]|nr:C40 family peptidase [Vicinamibacterales bacterium]